MTKVFFCCHQLVKLRIVQVSGAFTCMIRYSTLAVYITELAGQQMGPSRCIVGSQSRVTEQYSQASRMVLTAGQCSGQPGYCILRYEQYRYNTVLTCLQKGLGSCVVGSQGKGTLQYSQAGRRVWVVVQWVVRMEVVWVGEDVVRMEQGLQREVFRNLTEICSTNDFITELIQ